MTILEILKKLKWATIYSLKGLQVAWQFQFAFRLEMLSFVFGLPLACFIGHSLAQKIILMFSLLLILVVELLNSAIETVVNRIGLEFHELSGRAKDLGSAAVFISVLNAIATWLIVLLN